MNNIPPNLFDNLKEEYLAVWEQSKEFEEYISSGNEVEQKRWRGACEGIELNDSQKSLIKDFKRELNLLCLSGLWCGDCAHQMPLVARISAESQVIKARFIDPEKVPEFGRYFRINGAQRVPVVIALSEDFFFLGQYGDRPLSTYRHKAEKEQGEACALPGAATSLREEELSDWLREIERWQLIVRLSPYLRKRHGD